MQIRGQHQVIPVRHTTLEGEAVVYPYLTWINCHDRTYQRTKPFTRLYSTKNTSTHQHLQCNTTTAWYETGNDLTSTCDTNDQAKQCNSTRHVINKRTNQCRRRQPLASKPSQWHDAIQRKKVTLSETCCPAHGVMVRCYSCYANVGWRYNSRLADFHYLFFFAFFQALRGCYLQGLVLLG